MAFEYDGDGRLVRAGDYAFRYDPVTGLPSQADGLTVTEELAFSEYAELVSTKVTTPNVHVLSFEYLRDDLGRVTAKKETIGTEDPVLFEYSYDASNRLTEVRRDGVAVGAWTYDAAGNRATETRQGKTTTGVFDPGDRMLSWGTTTYAWGSAGDLQGSTRQDEAKASYKYDALGNLLEARLPGGRKVEYLVDHAGRRVGKKVDGVLVQRFLWESPLRIAAELDGEGNLVSRFVYGTKVNVPELIIKHGVTYRVLTDELGSPRLIFDPATEAVVQRMDYDAWGNVTADSNPGFQPFGFAGGLWDRDLGWVRFGARDYDPETGTWTRPEPILASAGAVAGYAAAGVRLGKYAYAGNNPIGNVDPTGLWNVTVSPGMEESLREFAASSTSAAAMVAFLDAVPFPVDWIWGDLPQDWAGSMLPITDKQGGFYGVRITVDRQQLACMPGKTIGTEFAHEGAHARHRFETASTAAWRAMSREAQERVANDAVVDYLKDLGVSPMPYLNSVPSENLPGRWNAGGLP